MIGCSCLGRRPPGPERPCGQCQTLHTLHLPHKYCSYECAAKAEQEREANRRARLKLGLLALEQLERVGGGSQ